MGSLTSVERNKIIAERNKLLAESAKLGIEAMKLNTENRKMTRELFWYPMFVAAAVTSVLTALFTFVFK